MWAGEVHLHAFSTSAPDGVNAANNVKWLPTIVLWSHAIVLLCLYLPLYKPEVGDQEEQTTSIVLGPEEGVVRHSAKEISKLLQDSSHKWEAEWLERSLINNSDMPVTMIMLTNQLTD